ncbi:hypothetical protein [Ruania albidiflava]|uniref:hypothetical protein n=1 Tax=Ruania albidiflava TaxID=366586 RepID=UPI0003B417DB|nr:hypothetical protein [Ruania albidiflava]
MTGSTRGRLPVRIGVAALLLLAAGCTSSGASEETSSPAPDEAAATGSGPAATDAPAGGEIPVPTVRALTTPPGFTDVMPAELTDQWADIVTSPECVLAGRAGTTTEAVDDMRAASVQRLDQLAAENGASPDDATDIDLTTQGAGEGNDPHQVLTLVTGDWQTGDEMVRGLSRVGNLVQYDGSLVSQWLDLIYTCTGEIDEEVWTAVIEGLRPVMQVGEGWDGLAPGDS